MKVAICAQGPDLGAPVDPRFGRCAYLVLVDPAGGQPEVIPNPGSEAARGAGTQTAQLLVDRNVEVVLAGQMGPHALAVLDRAGIKVYSGVTGTVADTLQRYRRGELPPAVRPGFGGGHGGSRR